MSFKEIKPEEWDKNPFEAIGKDWMLVTAGTEEHLNTMTASWGGVGVIWGKPSATAYVRQTRYTKEFIDNSEFFTSVDREDIFYLSCLTGRLCRDIIFPFNKIKSLEFFTPNESLSEIFRMLPTSINTLSDIFKEFSLFPKCRKLFAYAENIQKLSDSEGQLYFSVLKNLSSGKNQDLITYDLAASAHGIFNDAIKISEYSIYTLIKNT